MLGGERNLAVLGRRDGADDESKSVSLKAMARKITWWAAAEILGVTDRTMRRWRERLEKDGYAGLADRRKGRPSAPCIALATVEEVLGLYKERYYDLNMRHFHEKLRDEHAIQLIHARYSATNTTFEGLNTPVNWPVNSRCPVPRSMPNVVILSLREWQTYKKLPFGSMPK